MKNKSDISAVLEFLIEGLLQAFIPPTFIYVIWKFMLVGYTSVPVLGYWQVFALVLIIREVAVVAAQEIRRESR